MPLHSALIHRPRRLSTLLLTGLVVACGGVDGSSDAMESDHADDAAPTSVAPAALEEAMVLTVDGETPELVQMTTCVATPGRGLGAQWSTRDFVGDGSEGLGVAAGFEGARARITITFRDRRWRADDNAGDVSFEMADTRTADGRSFVTVEATGRAAADGESVPFELSVTCEPGGR